MSTPATLISTSAADLIARHPVEAGRVRPHKTMDGAGFKLRVLTMDAGAVLREHRAPVPILVQVVTGRVLFRTGGDEHDLSAGGVIQVAADVPHELEAAEPSHVLLALMG
ncbi:MAG: cupin domain-containing protein [Microbacterium sp.]